MTNPTANPEKPPTKRLPPYKVLLHNDDVNSFEDVIKKIQDITFLSEEEAIKKASEAHLNKVALLLVTHFERAELIVQQFASCNITATMEVEP